MHTILSQEYVSCPSCGRTLFDLQEISAQIREKTSHLPGVSVIFDLSTGMFEHSYCIELELTLYSFADCNNGLYCEWARRDG